MRKYYDMITTLQIQKWIAADDLYRFYTSRAWKRKRAEVMAAHHNECQDCKSKGRYTPAVIVHHEKHVREYPQYAMDAYVIADGQRQRQLTPLCEACHDRRHPERLKQYKQREFISVERWD